MVVGKMSQSAINAAFERAAHLVFDAEPKIFKDDYAIQLSGIQDESTFMKTYNDNFAKLEQMSKENARAFVYSYRALALVRHRYTEDELAKAIERGISQYVILGAGLDSFAFRRPDLRDRVRVFEVDQPISQEWKKARLNELGIIPPENLIFVPVDFEKQSLNDELYKYGMSQDTPTFFSWLGVSQYLTETAVLQTLQQVASATPSSEIVFEYVLADSLLEGFEKIIVAGSKNRPEEPWISQFDTVALMEKLKEMDYKKVEDFGLKEASSLYLADRTDQLSPSALSTLPWNMLKIAHLMKAITHQSI